MYVVEGHNSTSSIHASAGNSYGSLPPSSDNFSSYRFLDRRSQLKLVGKAVVKVCMENQEEVLDLLVVEGSGHSLIGGIGCQKSS